MQQFLQRLPLLFVAAMLLLSSSAKDETISTATLAAGLVLLGAWMSVEVIRLWERSLKETEETIVNISEEER